MGSKKQPPEAVDPAIARLEQEQRVVAGHDETACINLAAAHNRSAITQLPPTDARANSAIQAVDNQSDREIAACHANADAANAAIAARERNEYLLQAQQERERASLIMILTEAPIEVNKGHQI